MKRILAFIFTLLLIQPAFAFDFKQSCLFGNERAVKRLINSQVRYANSGNYAKFISTYSDNYVNSDGFDLETYSKLVRDIWNSYTDIKYGIEIKSVTVKDNKATVEVTETSKADLNAAKNMQGKLYSISDSIYYLDKTNNGWKVSSDKVLNETTTMLYGDALGLDISLTVPQEIKADTEYTASLEFTPPKDTLAIASLAADKVEYPQKPTKEVFRALPEDNILERLFTSNTDKTDEYIVASIGLTKTDICDLSIKLSLTGFGYVIKRVNVIPVNQEGTVNE